ncbi:GNAT family N-acetyltransferase [Alcanivorax sp. JB21]|uniref:GNAT family N-acetyltransferase n=1 Tax=Alcanivorax limicola TaxID=2874102 RepID=UPI001CBE9E0A|nr:GNAT family N-acetyltransferase [Alcanivorax limicola]MBZ2187913.1 GNAT family N-acetyltransferase [Alcanivorax limicola]
MPDIRRAGATDLPLLASTLARAFRDDPFWRWMAVPDQHYTRRLEAAFLAQLRHLALPSGLIHTVESRQAAALWSPPGTWGSSLLSHFRFLPELVRLCGVLRLPARLHGIRRVQALHPVTPHFYLQIIGVDPRAQGRGLCRLLLDNVLTQCDRSALPAYLETCNPDNVPLYQHFGFDVLHELSLPDDGPTVWCMWRATSTSGASETSAAAPRHDRAPDR